MVGGLATVSRENVTIHEPVSIRCLAASVGASLMRLFSIGLLILSVMPLACAPMGPATRSESDPDSLRAANARLRAEVRSLRDSLRFRDDIKSGQYDRERRTLKDQVDQLVFELRLLREGGLTVARLPSDSLFSAPATLSDAGADRLRSVATQLQQTYPNRTVRVEGHTDAVDVGEELQETFPSNWELSTARATAVVRELIARSGLDPAQFVAVGFGSTRPRASNDTAAGRRRNRRVRIAVLPRPGPYTDPGNSNW